jgi:hypothetical protein
MPEHFAFYSTTYETLPDEDMRSLAGAAEFSVGEAEDGGKQFVYCWPNVQITCNEMPAHQVPNHVQGFTVWIQRIYQGNPDERGKAILARIGATRLVVGVVVEPLRDEQGIADQWLGTLSSGLNALMLFGSALFDAQARLLLAPDATFNPEAEIGNVANERVKAEAEVPVGKSYEAAPAQLERHARVSATLKERQVPALSYALHVDDADHVTLRTPQEVARRALVLSAVTLRADGASRADAHGLIEDRQLWPAVSPEERVFLEASEVDPEQAQKLLWRLESVWVLLWALGDTDELGWPSQMCDVPRLVQLLERHESDPSFVEQARLRSKTDILDELQTTLLLHWAIRDAWVHRRSIPEDLDWSGSTPMVTAQQSPASGVIAERHHTLNWLVRFGDADWDDVDTPT